jgi:predicted metal-dependent hydrolase
MHFQLRLTTGTQLAAEQVLTVAGEQILVLVKRNPRARRYILRLDRSGQARVTIPRGGSAAEARRFTEDNKKWLERQLRQLANAPKHSAEWLVGSEFLFRGETVRIEAVQDTAGDSIRFGPECVKVKDVSGDLRPAIERHLWKLATAEMPRRVLEFAAANRLRIHRVCIRDQKSRWGSCSRKGTISLNWRLIQAPQYVSDYIIIHELMHLRQMNHSPRFWREVESVCAGYKRAECWLKQNSHLLKQC